MFATADNENLSSSVTATINEGAKTITVILPYGTDFTGLIPTIEVSAGATISPTGEQDFSSAVTYTVTAEDASTVDYTTTITIADQLPFVTTWQTATAEESITIYTNSDETGYNYTIDWGDGVTTTGLTGDASHIYTEAGTYTVSIIGDFPAIYQYNRINTAELLTIESWGDIAWKNMKFAFDDCNTMTYNATDVPNLSSVTDMSFMFSGASNFDGDISSWDVSSVTNMSRTFSGAKVFNGDISSWDVSSVTNMSFMFSGASNFDGDISSWEVGAVTDMSYVFRYAYNFNGDISNWDVSDVTDMSYMFYDASAFNKDLSGWHTAKVTACIGFNTNSGLDDDQLPTAGSCFTD